MHFFFKVGDSPARAGALLDLSVTDPSELISDTIGGSQGCSDHALVKFTVLRDMSQEKSEVRTPNFKKANFELFKEFASGAPWETAFRGKGVEQSWQILDGVFQGAPELSFSISKKSGKGATWLLELKGKKEMHSGSRGGYPGKSIGTLSSCVGMGSG